jgi:hypothetical protein
MDLEWTPERHMCIYIPRTLLIILGHIVYTIGGRGTYTTTHLTSIETFTFLSINEIIIPAPKRMRPMTTTGTTKWRC